MTETGTAHDIFWQLAGTDSELAQCLDCPTFGERSTDVNVAWADYLADERRRAAILMTSSNRDGEGDPDYAADVQRWLYWNQRSEIVRADHLNTPVWPLGRNRDAFADVRFGHPSRNLAFNASDLIDAPRLMAVLEEEVDPDDLLDIDFARLYEVLKQPKSAEELLAFAERVYRSHVALLGQDAFDALLRRDMEGESRERLFNFCRTQQVMDNLTEADHGYPLFEAVVMASSLVRWARFWGKAGISTRVILPLEDDEEFDSNYDF